MDSTALEISKIVMQNQSSILIDLDTKSPNFYNLRSFK